MLTSAGKAAAVDLCLHLVQHDHGARIANAVARRLVVSPHRSGGQGQFVATPVEASVGTPLSDVLVWAQERLQDPLSVADLARRANISPRHLGRQFRSVTGQSPLQWLLTERVRRAQEMLEATDRSIEQVARSVGLGSAATLRCHFHRVVGIPPDSYRRTFRAS